MKSVTEIIIPNFRIFSIANTTEGIYVRHRRNKKQKQITTAYLYKHRPVVTLPCSVRLTRISPRRLDDHDNLHSSLKYIVDTIADYIIPGKRPGFADNSKEITWIYNQEK